MVKILDLIDPQCIKLELESRKKKELAEEMADLLFQSGKINAFLALSKSHKCLGDF